MTPVQKIKWAILARHAELEGGSKPPYPFLGVGETFEKSNEDYGLQDAINEVRGSGIETGIDAPYSRHYESKSVGMKMPDGSWVGWTYWYGGGKFGEPEEVNWIDDAYDLAVTEEQKMVTVRTFTTQ